MSMGGGNPAIEISVTARIDELEQGLKAAQAKVDGTVGPMGKAGERAGIEYSRQFSAILSRGVGALSIAKVLSSSLEEASKTFLAGGSLDQTAESFVNGLADAFKRLPIVGPLTQALENFTNGVLDRLFDDGARFNTARDRFIEQIQGSVEGVAERTTALKQQAKDIAQDRFLARFAGESPELARDAKIEVENQRKLRPLLEEQRKLKDRIFEQESHTSNLQQQNNPIIAGAAEKALKTLRDEYAAREAVIQQMKAQTKEQIKQNEARDTAEINAIDLKYKEEKAKEATDAAAKAAKSKRDADIKALQQTGKAREEAIAAQIAALEKQSPAARAASIGALTQQFAGNMGGNIQTALGTFRGGGAAVAERAFQEAKAQTEKQEKIVRLQEEMKRLHEETNRKLDAMKGAA